MRLLSILFTLTLVEAKRRRLEKEQDNVDVRKNNVDVYPERFGEAIDFGHVYRDGYRNQQPDEDLDMINPSSVEHARRLLKKIGSDLINIKNPEVPMGFASPRDAMMYRNRMGEGKYNVTNTKHSLLRSSRLRNVTQTRKKFGEKEARRSYPDQWSRMQEHPPEEIFSNNNSSYTEQFFSKSGFNLVSDETMQTGNWTTCKEFAKGAVFHPDDVVNIPWLPFYIWSMRSFSTAVIHTLTYPTKKLVKQYKEKFGPYLNFKLDWEQPKLLLKEAKDMLLFAGDRKGLFYGIPNVDLPSPTKSLKIKLPLIQVRLKIVDPYLAMMFCDDNYAVIMCVAGTEPATDKEKNAEAAMLKFHGVGKPAKRDLEFEKNKAKYEIENKRREEADKYVHIERPESLGISSW